MSLDKVVKLTFVTLTVFQVGLAFNSRVIPMILGTLLSMTYLLGYLRKVELSNKQLILFFTLFFHSVIYLINSFEVESFIRVINCAFICLVTSVFFNSRDKNKLIVYTLVVAWLFLFLELVMRMPSLNPVYIFNTVSSNLHILKFGTPFFSDSNGVGIFALCIYILCDLTYKENKFMRYFFLSSFILFTLLTISRSCILGLVLYIVISILKNYSRISVRVWIFVCFLISTLLLIPTIVDILSIDNSSNDRLLVFIDLFNRIGSDGYFKLLFGYGETIGKTFFTFREGHYAHAFIPLVLGQSGLVSFISFLFLAVLVSYKNEDVFYYLIIISIIGLIFLPPYFEIVYYVLSILLSVEFNKNKERF
ncbi:hypothetical protein AAFX30_00570 [Vibrio chagasii]|uniref:hypothetical protein n=1 Tax=Vibrio chagasii TaxID=170679 RepID=UPI0038CD2031